MIKKIKNGGMVVIDKSHKALYSTPVSCMEYFNTIILTVSVIFKHVTLFTISNTSSKRWCVFYYLN